MRIVRKGTTLPRLTIAAALLLGSAAPLHAASPTDEPRAEARGRAQADIETRRREALEQGQRSLDKEAIAALEETRNASRLIAQGRTREAMAALERATGKIDLLVARNPATALVPVAVEVEVIDTAPLDPAAIEKLADATESAVDARDFPTARTLLANMISELRVRTTNLPLAGYPVALKEAARLLDAQQPEQANAVLLTALNTLVMLDRVTPLPVLVAQTAIADAAQHADKAKDAGKLSLEVAKLELERAEKLGYARGDAAYASLENAIASLEEKIAAGGDTDSAFAQLKERIAGFVGRLSSRETGRQVAERRPAG
jgi:hypothetical protein